MSKKIPLIEVKDLNLAFPLKAINESSLRDTIIAFLQHPIRAFQEKKAFYALRKINFQAFEGERVGLLGVNGAGKSTLCRCLTGIYTPPEGEIITRGRVRALFDSSLSMFPELSGRENLKVLSEIYFDYQSNDMDKIIEESIEFSELGEFIDVPIKAYSKGMLLRLSMSLLSATPADILILDEVFDGADEFFREKLSQRIKKLINQSGLVIFVSHQDTQLLDVCDRTLLLNNGQIVFDGPPAKALDLYRAKFSDQGQKKL